MKQLRDLQGAIDDRQRASRPVALAYAVAKKFDDDNANQYVVALGWYGFVAIYPLLLVVITILGFIGAPTLGNHIISTLHEFPIVGSQFGPENSSQRLRGSGLGLAIGLVGSIYGAQGVTQTLQQAMAGVWNVPKVDMPKFLLRLARSLLALFIIGTAYLMNAVGGAFVTSTGWRGPIRPLTLIGLFVLNGLLYLLVFRVATPGRVTTRGLLPGAALASVGFTSIITIGSGLVQHQLRHSSATYGQFGVVIGLVGFLLLVAKISLYGAELNPVVARHLWPRGLLIGAPTEADDRVLSDIAHQDRRREDQRIGVGFGEDAAEKAADDARRDPSTVTHAT